MISQLTYDITIPVLNEEERLPVGVPTLYKYLQTLDLKSFSITIADNGSTDATETVANKLVAEFPGVKYLKVGKRGVGLALKASWKQSTADIIGYMDVDLATDIHHFPDVVRRFEQESAQVVNGSRNMAASHVVNRTVVRSVFSRCFNFILRHALGVNFTDGMCGFKFIRRSLYQRLLTVGLESDGWFFCTELLTVAERTGQTISEIPVNWTDDQNSRVRLIRLSLNYLQEIYKLRRRRIGKLPTA